MPNHVGIIMDGNGRWAARYGKPRFYGHQHGLETFKNIVKFAASEMLFREMTVYALSKDNFKRSSCEVDALLGMLQQVLTKELDWFRSLNIKVRFIGDTSVFSDKIQNLLARFTVETKACSGLKLNVAINFSGRFAIAEAVKNITTIGSVSDIVDNLEQNLNLTPIDLLIRTSGEQRLSDFCLWQLAYAEIYFSELLWPEFDSQALVQALNWFKTRDRRFGEVYE